MNRKKALLAVLFCVFILLGIFVVLTIIHNSEVDEFGLGNPGRGENNIVTWNCIYFGTYPQNDTNRDGVINQSDKKESIRWRVLSIEGNVAFLLSDLNLDCKPYHETWGTVTWDSCSLRQWLNTDFFKSAFTEEEQYAIQETAVKNTAGDDTKDKVYLLSYDEICNENYGFYQKAGSESKTREARNTAYTVEQGAISSDNTTGNWWLRSYDVSQEVTQRVNMYGSVDNYISVVACSSQTAVRPVIHLDLSKAKWSKADNVTCLGSSIY